MRALIAASVLGALTSACDPDLTVQKVPADASVDAPQPAVGDAAAPSSDAPSSNDGGEQDGETDAPAGGHVIDGINDFTPGETFATSSTTYTAYVSWDDKSVYFGMLGEDIGKPASDKKWVLAYFGVASGAGTTNGIDYSDGGGAASQQPTLPFSAQHHARLKTDLSYLNGQTWSGSAWAAGSLVPDCERKDTFVECRVSRAALGNPTMLSLHVSMVKEQAGAEWTYAAVPQTSFTDGKDPNYGKYFEFDLTKAPTAPNTSAAK